MKPELKHLAPYLPYGLKLFYTHTEKIGQISNIYSIGEGFDNDDIKISIDYSDGEHIWMYKPILRPLADLDKDIDIKGWFIPFDDIYLHPYRNDTKEELKEKLKEPNIELPYWVMEKLFEWHFDVFGLIEKGLAIDINTLNS